MRSYKVRPSSSYNYYVFECPFCKYKFYKNTQEIKKYKFDICHCGAQIIFDIVEQIQSSSVTEKVLREEINRLKKEITKTISNKVEAEITKPIPLKPIKNEKKYDESIYISLLKKMGMKVGEAKILIKDLIGMGFDPKNETLFTTKLLENLK